MLFSKKTFPGDPESTIAYTAGIGRHEQRDIEHAFARLFSSEDGKKVLAWLQVMTFHRAGTSQTTEEYLRHMEGQRSLVATILRMIDHGKTN